MSIAASLRDLASRRSMQLFALVVVLLMFTSVLFPTRQLWLDGLSADGMGATLDRQFHYGAAEAEQILTNLGETGRSVYARSQVLLDFVFPLVYGALFGLLIVTLAPAAFAYDPAKHRRWLLAAPSIAVGADLVENVLGLVAVGSFPDTSPAVYNVAGVVTATKQIGVFASLALIAALAVAAVRRKLRGEIGKWLVELIPYIVLIRVPLITAIALVAVGRAGISSSPVIENMMLVDGGVALVFVTFLAIGAGPMIGFSLLLIWQHADLRFNVSDIRLPASLATPRVTRSAWFAILGLPVIGSVVARSTAPPDGNLPIWKALVAVPVGVAAAVCTGFCIEWLRKLFGPEQPVGRLVEPLQRWLGDGYYQEAAADGGPERALDGHALAASGATILMIIYTIGYWLLDPNLDIPVISASVPTLAYLLLVLMAICSLFSGLGFFLDRFRVPLLLTVAALATGLNYFLPSGHVFEIATDSAEAPPPIEGALGERLDRFASSPDAPVVTVVALAGGGIQAAGWSVEVLAGLQRALGAEFTQSIQLISSVSGGSVGAYYFLEGWDPERGAPAEQSLDPIRVAAMRSSLEAAAWGITYPALMRAFSPIRPPESLDRASAMEASWRLHTEDMKRSISQANGDLLTGAVEHDASFSDWWRAAAQGAMPGVVFNGTFVDDGQQFLLSNLDLSPLAVPGPDGGRSPLDDPDMAAHYPAARPLDMLAVTGARLSATFPYVTPVARARVPGEGTQPPNFHIADGGYFDNSGVLAAARWAKAVLDSSTAPPIGKIIFVEVRPFPEEDFQPPSDDRGWGYATLGPILTLLRVRTSSQAARGEFELSLLRDGGSSVEIERIVLQPVFREGRKAAPLSWHLANSNKEQICRDWIDQQATVSRIRDDFPNAPWAWPDPERCGEMARQALR